MVAFDPFVKAELARLGALGPKAAEEATLATRKTKGTVDVEGIVTRWQQEADGAGWGTAELDNLLSSVSRSTHTDDLDIDQLVQAAFKRSGERCFAGTWRAEEFNYHSLATECLGRCFFSDVVF